MKKVLLIVLCLVTCFAFCACGGEKFAWSDVVLGGLLPEPPSDSGKIRTNSSEDLWMDINDLSDKQFSDYVAACKEKGFTVDAESNSSSYRAYNAEGYELRLGHYGNNADMSIELKAPMEMTTIKWPTSIAGEQLPAPKSTTGNFNYEYSDNFFVYVGNTTKTDFAEYIEACSAMGFDVDYSKSDTHYYADNSDGWHVDIRYVGCNIMSIHIYAPKEDVEDTEASIEASEPNLDADLDSDLDADLDSDLDVGLDPDFKAAMDSYEQFMDDYVAFMKKYYANPTDMSLLSSYMDYLNKYATFVEDFEKWNEDDMNAAELAYYLDVQLRVSQKLLEIAS